MSDRRLSRRTFLHATTASAGIFLLAGCNGASGGSDGDTGGEGEDDATETPTADVEMRDFDGWFDRTQNYDGVYDLTGESSVTIDVGAEGNGGGFAFGPAAVKISPGTTVVWEWTGNGGTHNVLHRGGEFESELTASEGATFEHTFDETGEYKYVCVPHETLGMVGVVVVE
ncbi:halocyanin domain-containing protein [Haloferax sp. DFSO52]|uniref:halocyanin domain-containing protein n=1 Tax=Haloferax sp. DFSO52 TaxID=3388505 RepID=UPI003A863AB2